MWFSSSVNCPSFSLLRPFFSYPSSNASIFNGTILDNVIMICGLELMGDTFELNSRL